MHAHSEPPTHAPTSLTRATAARAVAGRLRALRAARKALLRRLVLEEDRIDVMATQVLGYDLRPFHLDMLRFQSAHDRALQLAPRGYGKSTVCNIARVVHEVVRDPNIRILIVSNTQLQAEVFLREVKYHFEHNPRLRAVFGDFVSDTKWDTREIIVRSRTSHAKESTVSCVGVGGPVVSRHYDLIVADDLIDEENSRTEGQRAKVREWFYRSFLPTLEPHGRIFVLGTRYHFEDLYGQLISAEYQDCHQVVRAIGPDGSTPWPEKFSLEWLEERRRSMGTLLFNGQYQNDVEAMKGRIFRIDWLRYFDSEPEGLRIYQGVDLAISKKETADYFAIVTVGVDAHRNVYVLDALARRLTFKQQTELIAAKFNDWRPIQTVVESNAYQAAQVEELRRTTAVRVRDVKTTKDKVTRFLRLSARFEAGQVFLRRGVMEELVEQLLLVPEGAHDDLVDALELAVEAAVSRGFGALPDIASIFDCRGTVPRARAIMQNPEWRPGLIRDGAWRYH